MVAYALSGKFNYRDYVLNLIEWQGDGTVLDVGTVVIDQT